MTSVRGLAFELSQVPAAQREQLLAELPAEARERMEALLREIGTLLDRPTQTFDRHLEVAAAQPSPLSGLNEGQLRLLLGAEHSGVQRRVSNIVRNGQLDELAPAVAAVVTAYLTRKVQANDIRSDVAVRAPRWWWKWTKAAR